MKINLFGQYEIIWQSCVGTADEYCQQSIEHSPPYAILHGEATPTNPLFTKKIPKVRELIYSLDYLLLV